MFLGALILLILHRSTAGLAPVLARFALKPRERKLAPQAEPLPRRVYPPHDSLLQVSKVSKRFGGLVAVRDMSFEVKKGEILGLIGPNGAGKSTMFNMMSGVLACDGGQVSLCGERIDGLTPSQIARRGMARSFQHVNLVGNMSVLDNVAIGAHLRGEKGVLSAMLRTDRAEDQRLLAEAARQIERMGLTEHMFDAAGTLALGKQRLVEIARALCADPMLLLLDEPAAGLRYAEKKALAASLAGLRAEGVSILLVEHDMDFLMNLADRIVVMQFGEMLTSGSPRQVQSNPAVIEAYLGRAA